MGLKKMKYLGLAVLFGSVVLSGCGASNLAFKQYEDVVEYKSRVSAEGKTTQEITLKGVSEPYQEVMVSSSVGGYLKEVLVELGSYVEKDQQLATLDDSDLKYQIEQARTLLNLNQAEAEIAAMEQQIALNEMKVNLSLDGTPDIKEQNNTITDLKRELNLARQLLKQNQSLLKSKVAMSQKEIDNIRTRIKEIDETNNRNNEIKGIQNRLNTIARDTANQNDQPIDDSAKQELLKEKDQLEKRLVQLEKPGKITYLIEVDLAKEKKVLEAKLKEQEEIDTLKKSIEEINQEILMIERDVAKANEILDTRVSQQTKQRAALSETSNLQTKSNAIATSRTAFELQRAEAEIKLLELHLNHLTVTAPANGYITTHNAIMGGATAANELLFSITNIDKLYVNINVPEAFINNIKQDQEVAVSFPTLGKTVEGKVTFISVMGNPNSQTFPVMVLIDNKEHEIKGGMAAQVTIVSKGK